MIAHLCLYTSLVSNSAIAVISLSLSLSLYIYIYIYIYTHTYIHHYSPKHGRQLNTLITKYKLLIVSELSVYDCSWWNATSAKVSHNILQQSIRKKFNCSKLNISFISDDKWRLWDQSNKKVIWDNAGALYIQTRPHHVLMCLLDIYALQLLTRHQLTAYRTHIRWRRRSLQSLNNYKIRQCCVNRRLYLITCIQHNNDWHVST